jgi:tripartite-type tricarboxylate transporter receptor subunit TctC
VPADRVAALRQAFADTLKDPAFLAEATKLQLEIEPLAGEEIQALLIKAYGSVAPMLRRASDLLERGGGRQ